MKILGVLQTNIILTIVDIWPPMSANNCIGISMNHLCDTLSYQKQDLNQMFLRLDKHNIDQFLN